MAITNTTCSCGKAITVRTIPDAKTVFRRDGKQVVYTDRQLIDGAEYDIFRCEGCSEPIHLTCAEAAYE